MSWQGERALFVDESEWIREALAGVPIDRGATVLDIGSSTLFFRTVAQPYVDRNVFAPMRARGLLVLHLDARPEPGVDIVADVTNLQGVDRTFHLVLCTNLLEHVTDRQETLRHVKRVVAPGGLLLLTVPRRYPIHPDPIDTGFRPTAAELVEMLGWPEVLRQEVLTVRASEHYRGLRVVRRLFRPWQIACVLARRPLTA
jgi:SAM-dependent methyltransferase